MSDAKYLAGVAIALCTTFMSALGLSLQKMAHKRIEKLKHDEARNPTGKPLRVYKQKKWIFGLALMAASALLSLAVFALVGQSVASAFASITIVYNIILSYLLLHERITYLDLGIAALMVTGTVLAVVFGANAQSSGFQSLDDILEIWSRPAAIAGFVLFGLSAISLAVFIGMYDRKVPDKASGFYRFTLLLRCLTAGLFSGFVGTFSKTVVSIFSSSVGGSVSDNLARWEPWVFLLLLPSCLVMQVIFLNSALKRFDATEAVPLYQSMVVIFGVVFGWTIYNEAAGKSGGAIAGFLSGIALIVIGILCLLFKRQTQPSKLATVAVVEALVRKGVLEHHLTRRCRSAPPANRPWRRLAEDNIRPVLTTDPPGLQALKLRVPLHYVQGRGVVDVHAVLDTCKEAVTPSYLFNKLPKGGGNSRLDMPASLRVHTVVPTLWRINTERAMDCRMKWTRAIAENVITLCEKQPLPSPRVNLDIAPLPFFGGTTHVVCDSSAAENDRREIMMKSLRKLIDHPPGDMNEPLISPQPKTEFTAHRGRARSALPRQFFSHEHQPQTGATAATTLRTYVHRRSHSTGEVVTEQVVAAAPPIQPRTALLRSPSAVVVRRQMSTPIGEDSMTLVPLALVQSLPYDQVLLQCMTRAQMLRHTAHGMQRRKRHFRRRSRASSINSIDLKQLYHPNGEEERKAIAVHVHETLVTNGNGTLVHGAATYLTVANGKEDINNNTGSGVEAIDA